MRGQVPGTARDRARTKSLINNTQTSVYVRAPEGVTKRGTEARHLSLAPHWLIHFTDIKSF